MLSLYGEFPWLICTGKKKKSDVKQVNLNWQLTNKQLILAIYEAAHQNNTALCNGANWSEVTG